MICLDPTLPRSVDIFESLSPKGLWVQATRKSFGEMAIPEIVGKVGLCDAFGIALRIFGRPITNSVMLGAFAKTTSLVSLSSIGKAMESADFRDAFLDSNIKALEQGYSHTEVVEIPVKEGL